MQQITKICIISCVVFLLFTTSISARLSNVIKEQNSELDTKHRAARSIISSDSNEDLENFCLHYCSNNNHLFAKRAYLKGFVHGRSADNDDEQIDKRFVHGKRSNTYISDDVAANEQMEKRFVHG